jgi:N-acyl amino acid synthase of PEP-CTERM/exosortase system
MADVLAASHSESLSQIFARSFSVVPANTPALRDALFRLRYQVYCIENQFENPADFRDGRETDAYDAGALHAALIHKASDSVIGGVRLIPPGPQSLPIRQVIGFEENRVLDAFPVQHSAEISRYTVSRVFRRRIGESQYPDTELHDWATPAEHRRILPNITLGLMRAILGFCAERDIRYLFATMAPALLRLLDGFGLHFERLGPCVHFHGLRQPCYASYADLLAGLRRHRTDFYDVVLSAFDRERLQPQPARIPRLTVIPGGRLARAAVEAVD